MEKIDRNPTNNPKIQNNYCWGGIIIIKKNMYSLRVSNMAVKAPQHDCIGSAALLYSLRNLAV